MTSLHRFTGWAFFLGFAILAVSLNACSSSGGNSGPGRVLTSIAVTPLTASINVNATQQFKATGTYSDGSTQDITSTAQWKSSDTTVATIQSNGGLASGAGAGTAQITASLSGIVSPPASLTVTASGSTPALVQHVSSSNTRNNGFSSPFCYHFQLPNPTTASNAVVVGFTFNGNPTPRVTDDKGNPYAIEANHFDSADNQSIGIAAAFNIAAGARVINLCFSADPGGFVQPMATEFSNVTGVDGLGKGSNGSGTSASTGNVTLT